jgi:hypothetical protein
MAAARAANVLVVEGESFGGTESSCVANSTPPSEKHRKWLET